MLHSPDVTVRRSPRGLTRWVEALLVSAVLFALGAVAGGCGTGAGQSDARGAGGATGAAGDISGPAGGSGSGTQGSGGSSVQRDGSAGTGGAPGGGGLDGASVGAGGDSTDGAAGSGSLDGDVDGDSTESGADGAAVGTDGDSEGGPDGGAAGESGLAPHTSGGTRIRPRYAVLDDGTKVLFDFFDLGLGGPCAVKKDGAGVYHCVPSFALENFDSFADPSCMTPADLVVVNPICEHSIAADESGYRAIGALVSVTETLYTGNINQCATADIPPTSQLRALGPPLQPVEFHDENETLVPGRLDAVVHVGTDGSRIWLGDLFDLEHGVPAALQFAEGHDCCYPPNNSTFDARAFPVASPAHWTSALAAEECCSLTQPGSCPMFNGEGFECPERLVLSSGAPFVTDIGDTSTQVYPIGPPFVEAYCGTMSGSTCVLSTVAPSTALWATGPALSQDEFVLAQRVVVGSNRFTSSTYMGEGVQFPSIDYVEAYGLSGIFDTQASAQCYLFELEDGKFHCVTQGVGAALYVDSACTQPVARWSGYAYLGPDAVNCSYLGPYRLFAVGAPYASGASVQTYQLGTNGSCTPFVTTQVRELGDAVDPSTIPEVDVVQE